jgi:hypothetical protein
VVSVKGDDVLKMVLAFFAVGAMSHAPVQYRTKEVDDSHSERKKIPC